VARARKGLTDPDFLADRVELLTLHDDGWARVVAHLPKELSAEREAKLRAEVAACCSRFLMRHRRMVSDAGSAAALRRPKAKRLAPFERFVHGLRTAAEAWQEIGSPAGSAAPPVPLHFAFHGCRPVDAKEYARLAAMAKTAAAQLALLQKLTPIEIVDPFELLVLDLADAVRAAEFKPTISGRRYDEPSSSPSWFQLFVTEVDRNLLGSRRLFRGDRATGEAVVVRDPKSTYDAIKKAVRTGGGKPGNRRI
jgi:hypothetical protein